MLNVSKKLLIDIYERWYKIIVNGKCVVAAGTFLSDELYQKILKLSIFESRKKMVKMLTRSTAFYSVHYANFKNIYSYFLAAQNF